MDSLLTRFFANTFHDFMMRIYGFVWIIFFCFGLSSIVFIFEIEPLSKEEEYLPSDHPTMVTAKLIEDNFLAAASLKDAVIVSFIWGVAGLDRSDVGRWDATDLGKVIWDDSFTMSPPENQKFLLDLCDDIDKQDDLVIENTVKCWIKDMDDFVREDSG